MTTTKLLIAFTFLASLAACITTGHYRIYLGEDAGSRFESDTISEMKTLQFPDIGFLGYRGSGYTILDGSYNEDVKRLGLILTAKSVFTRYTKQTLVFGRLADSCTLNYELTEISTRMGRSATVSALNFSDAINGRPYTRQAEPYTYFNKKTASGTIGDSILKSAFIFEHLYNNLPQYSGWLVLNNDTLRVRPVQKLVNDKAVIKDAGHDYTGGFELFNGEKVFAAFVWSFGKKEVYILKQLREPDKNTIASFLFAAACAQ